MPTIVTETVGTADRDFSTLTAAEAALPADITSEGTDEIRVFECYKDSVLTDVSFTIAGTIIAPTNYIELTVAVGDRHTGTRGTGLILRPVSSLHCISAQTNIRIFYFELDCDGIFAGTNGIHLAGVTIAAGDRVYLGNNLIYDNTGSINSNAININNGIGGNDYEVYVYGNTILNCSAGGVRTAFGHKILLYNNTILNNNTGDHVDRHGVWVPAGGGIITAINNIGMENGSTNKEDFSLESRFTTKSNNMSSDDTAPGDDSLINQTASDQFTTATAGSEDVSLLATSNALNVGTPIASLGVTPDILEDALGVTRGQGAGWDMGAYEREVASGSGAIKAIYYEDDLF